MARRVAKAALFDPPLSVIRGEQIDAVYLDQSVPEFVGNPLIESLPAFVTHGQLEERLSYFPPYDPKQRELSEEIRLHLLENARELWVPQAIHYEVHLSISNMLRRGYIDRNPAKRGAPVVQREKVRNFISGLQQRAFLRSRARGVCVVGVGGLGKSTAIERILSLYPQVITHSSYKGESLVLKQLVWVKLQCPGDGSLRALCKSFLTEVDDILKTTYYVNFRASTMTKDDLLVAMARVASNHYVGVVFFDEIQDLSEAKSGGAAQMLNFFVQMENVLGIPFGLIGTPKARMLFAGEFRQARRVSEQGDFFWHPMREIADEEKPDTESSREPDPEWEIFVRAMWKYWYLRKGHSLPTNILEDEAVRRLYDCSKGIPAVVVTIFLLAQRRAITSGKEDITKAIINSTVRDCQYFVSQIFDSLRDGQDQRLGKRYRLSDIDSSEWRPPSSRKQRHDSSKKNAKPLHVDSEASSESSIKKKRNKSAKKKTDQYEESDLRRLLDSKVVSGEAQVSVHTDALGVPDEFD
ncbi:MAG TPA: ATP-binding protein [Pyrinomonadaceae bacterium]|nr:ATP-binding protein [Pyrinomonadaceae bacterium]